MRGGMGVFYHAGRDRQARIIAWDLLGPVEGVVGCGRIPSDSAETLAYFRNVGLVSTYGLTGKTMTPSAKQPLPDAVVSVEHLLAAFPHVLLDPDNLEHFQGILNRQLLFSRCADCGYWIGLNAPSCPACWSDAVRQEEVSGRGQVFMFTFSYPGHQASRDGRQAFAGRTCWAAVELAERPGLRYLAPVTGCPEDEIAIGLEVSLHWTGDEPPVPFFRPSARGDVMP
jgi:uncharacterized protein